MNENSTISNVYDGKHDEYGHDLPRWMNFEHVIDLVQSDMRSVVPFGWQAAFCAARTRAYDPLATLADL